MNIGEIKKDEMLEILNFYNGIKEYGHIFHLPPELLDVPFNKILDGIAEVQKLMDDSFSM